MREVLPIEPLWPSSTRTHWCPLPGLVRWSPLPGLVRWSPLPGLVPRYPTPSRWSLLRSGRRPGRQRPTSVSRNRCRIARWRPSLAHRTSKRSTVTLLGGKTTWRANIGVVGKGVNEGSIRRKSPEERTESYGPKTAGRKRRSVLSPRCFRSFVFVPLFSLAKVRHASAAPPRLPRRALGMRPTIRAGSLSLSLTGPCHPSRHRDAERPSRRAAVADAAPDPLSRGSVGDQGHLSACTASHRIQGLELHLRLDRQWQGVPYRQRLASARLSERRIPRLCPQSARGRPTI